MTHTLPQVGHEHHELIFASVNGFPALADGLLSEHQPPRADFVAVRDFLAGTLLPHVDAAEQAIYPELERMFQNRHSMAPMRREHEEIRRLVGSLTPLVDDLHGGGIGLGRALALRRVLFQLYALLKIHLAEEEAYLRIVDRGVGDEAAEVLAAAMAHPVR
jgi:hypothetical protein